MIHSDGRPIANVPARQAPFEVVGSFVYEEVGDSLLERDVAGVRVTLPYFANHPVLRVRDAKGEHSVIGPKDRALDAFNHPYLYLVR